MKQAEIWFHMKKVPLYEDICTRLLYFDIVCGPETTVNSNCEKQLSTILRSWILSKQGVKGKRPSSCAACRVRTPWAVKISITFPKI
jgi:hypothetical protein